MSTPREEQIQRLADAINHAHTPFFPGFAAIAAKLYDAGARIPDPPPAPEVVVTEEAYNAAMMAWRGEGGINSVIRAAFPHLLAANPWAIDAAIRERTAKITRGNIVKISEYSYPVLDDLLTALGVAP